ncbi:ABC transporter ATP-binding protein [Bradyrhizobium sp. HKCCYLRH1073]|uniref:ABC transporter ATP-binding protein n=1 Tax=unclassified Bradyrhizobium TaxID=2631580 RepID=UPI00291641D7|nr:MULTISPECIES: ABC transporter ATP-binding protein [unclassified Bradyrhizobium]
MTAILEVSNLCAGYGDFQALFNIDLEIAAGEVIALIGANGAGKSTLLKAVTGLITPSAGKIAFAGEATANRPAHALVRKGLAMVPEGRRLFRGMTVEDNLRVCLDRARTDVEPASRWTIPRIHELFPALKERRRELVERLSGGQQQMVAIGRALLAQPRLLLCDEISLGLAPKVVKEIYQKFPEIRASGTSIVIVEQDVSLAKSSSDFLFCMLEGRVTLSGPSREIGIEEISRAYFGAHS